MGALEKNNPAGSDTDLLQRHLDGDPRALAALIRRYRRELYGFLVRFTGDTALAEDIFQETFLRVHLSAGLFDMRRRFRPWLFTVASNKARDALRSRRRRTAVSLDAPADDGEGETSYADLMPSDVPPPDENFMNLETRQAVQTIVRNMPEPLRLVLSLGYFHEMPYQEIAEVLAIPLGTVKSRLHAAVRHFAEEWKRHAEPTRRERAG
jgi:RNA polymerase sigma-70 factor (ECF subfamily)